MPSPLFAYHAAPSVLPPNEAHARLTGDPDLLTAATADTVRRGATGSHRFALRACALPSVTAARSGRDEPGSVRIRWEGAEERTGWPAMVAWLVVGPRGVAGSRITLVSPRAPASGLLADRLQRAHARRLLAVSIQSFLHAVVEQVESRPLAGGAADVPSTRAPGVAQTSNRIGRRQRDQGPRQQAVAQFLDVMVEQPEALAATRA